MTKSEHDVFLSYTWSERDLALRIERALQARKMTVFRDEHIQLFDGITEHLARALDSSKVFLALYSVRYPTRYACQWELTRAFLAAQRLGDPRARVLVVNHGPDESHIAQLELEDAAYFSAARADVDLDRLTERVRDKVRAAEVPLARVSALAGNLAFSIMVWGVGIPGLSQSELWVCRRGTVAVLFWRAYYPYVVSIIKKRRAGRTYLYAVTSARVGGQLRIVDQVYLGAEDEVIARLTGPAGDGLTLPDDTMHRRFGDVAAVWGMFTRLDAVAVIDGVLGDARVSGGVSVGTYLVLAALNRICDPRSKAGLATWWAGTALGAHPGDPDGGVGPPPVLGRHGPGRGRAA